jgi:hypothetical protein
MDGRVHRLGRDNNIHHPTRVARQVQPLLDDRLKRADLCEAYRESVVLHRELQLAGRSVLSDCFLL